MRGARSEHIPLVDERGTCSCNLPHDNTLVGAAHGQPSGVSRERHCYDGGSSTLVLRRYDMPSAL